MCFVLIYSYICKTQKQLIMPENYFLPIPSQALKTWRYFDRFNVNHYHKVLNERKDREIELTKKLTNYANRKHSGSL